MTNEQIIKSIKAGDGSGAKALADKYGITAEQAERIAEAIVEHNAHGIRKMQDKWTHGFKILVRWHGRGYLGSFDTSTEFCFGKDGNLFAVYGD